MIINDVDAIFIDYTGTMVRDDDPYTLQLLKLIFENSNFETPNEALGVVWKLIKDIESNYKNDNFLTKDKMVDHILDYLVKNHALSCDLTLAHDLWRNSWIHANLYDDVRSFFDKYSDRIYIITNDDLCYVEQSMAEKDLHPAGIIAADTIKFCKPHVEILLEAIKKSNTEANRCIMIGDSITSDVECAIKANIRPVLLDRAKKATDSDSYIRITTLDELIC